MHFLFTGAAALFALTASAFAGYQRGRKVQLEEDMEQLKLLEKAIERTVTTQEVIDRAQTSLDQQHIRLHREVADLVGKPHLREV